MVAQHLDLVVEHLRSVEQSLLAENRDAAQRIAIQSFYFRQWKSVIVYRGGNAKVIAGRVRGERILLAVTRLA